MFRWVLTANWQIFRPRGSKVGSVGTAAMNVSSAHSKLLTWHIAPEPTREEPSLQTSAISLELSSISWLDLR